MTTKRKAKKRGGDESQTEGWGTGLIADVAASEVARITRYWARITRLWARITRMGASLVAIFAYFFRGCCKPAAIEAEAIDPDGRMDIDHDHDDGMDADDD